MAAVLDALAPYVEKLITDMVQEEVSMVLGVSEEITKLHAKMGVLTAFVSDAERRRITDLSVQRWVTKLKNAMYDATDILDLCQLEAPKHKAPSCFHPLLFCLQNPVFAHNIGSHIKELNQRLENIHKEAAQYNFNITNSSKPEPRKLTAAELSSHKTSSQVDESAIVGEQIERDTKELIQILTTKDNTIQNIKVVSIIGAGGMGKTTLAQKIFNDATIQEHFKLKIWLSITQQFDVIELLRTTIENAGGDHAGSRDKGTLTDTLISKLSMGNFLLVMDDVWSYEAWENVLRTPVENASKKHGCRVLVTTRSAHLPQMMQAPLHEHRVRPLNKKDAWSLLKRQLQPNQVMGIDQLKTIGMKILKKCDGLPVAIKVIGGLLSTRYPSEHEWKAVLKMPAWSLAGLPPELDNRLYLSYEDLSPQLKQCFLYCSLFPKGKRIKHNVITRMWISEGFIKTYDEDYGLEDIATEYYQELIKRNLIEPAEQYSATGYTCTMHDVIRSFAEYIVREESVVRIGKDKAKTDGGGMPVRRLSVGKTIAVVEWDDLQSHESLRTLIINSRVSLHPGHSLGRFSSLRVLYIKSANSNTLAPSLTRLKHLRYLHLEDTDISRLPDDIHEMKFLLYIALRKCQKLCYLPGSIIKLVDLRSLHISGSNVSIIPKGLSKLTNLRSLYGFPVHVDLDASSLQELGPLFQLRKLTLYGLEKVHDSRVAEKAMIRSKCHLSYLELNYSASAHKKKQPSLMEKVLEKLCPPTSIENLSLTGGYIGRHLPKWMNAPASRDFKSLRFLTLQNLPCCTQLPDGLCCLPCLEFLTIMDAPTIKRIDHQFQASSVASGSYTLAPFPKLRELQLNGLCELEDWEWNDREEQRVEETVIAMPYLETLKIINCKLSCLPSGLATIRRHDLRELHMHELTNLTHLENFPSVVELYVSDCPELKRISSLPRMQKIRISCCTKLEVLEGVPALDSLVLNDATMDTVPEYLRTVNPRYLELGCNMELLDSPERYKIRHIREPWIEDLEYSARTEYSDSDEGSEYSDRD